MVTHYLLKVFVMYICYIEIIVVVMFFSVFTSIQVSNNDPILIYAWAIEHFPWVGLIYSIYLLIKNISKPVEEKILIAILILLHVMVTIWMQWKYGPYL